MLDPIVETIIRQVRLVVFDFDGVFTDNTVLVSEDGREFVRCWRGDGLGLRQLERLGIQTIIISTEENPVVAARSRKLVIRCIQGSKDKRATLKTVLSEMELTTDDVAYVGNDINDACCLEMVALPIVVQDAHPDVLPLGLFRTQTRGGYGAVREVCDLFKQVLEGKDVHK